MLQTNSQSILHFGHTLSFSIPLHPSAFISTKKIAIYARPHVRICVIVSFPVCYLKVACVLHNVWPIMSANYTDYIWTLPRWLWMDMCTYIPFDKPTCATHSRKTSFGISMKTAQSEKRISDTVTNINWSNWRELIKYICAVYMCMYVHS